MVLFDSKPVWAIKRNLENDYVLISLILSKNASWELTDSLYWQLYDNVLILRVLSDDLDCDKTVNVVLGNSVIVKVVTLVSCDCDIISESNKVRPSISESDNSFDRCVQDSCLSQDEAQTEC